MFDIVGHRSAPGAQGWRQNIADWWTGRYLCRTRPRGPDEWTFVRQSNVPEARTPGGGVSGDVCDPPHQQYRPMRSERFQVLAQGGTEFGRLVSLHARGHHLRAHMLSLILRIRRRALTDTWSIQHFGPSSFPSVVGGTSTVADGGGAASLATRCARWLKTVWATPAYDEATGRITLASRQTVQAALLTAPFIMLVGAALAVTP